MTLKCPTCSKQFKYSKNLRYHIINNTCKDRCYKCPKCKSTYKLYSSLKRHMKVKHNEKIENVDLPICTEKINKINYQDEKEYECIYCDKKYTNKYVLKKHITHHCSKNPNIKKIIENNDLNQTNMVNNIINSNNMTINNNITIQLNNFGEESLKNITDEEFMKALTQPNAIPSKFIELKYIKQKENRNIYRNSKEDKLYVRKNNNWVVEPREDEIYHQMKIKAIDDIDEFIKKDGLRMLNKNEIDKRLNRIERSTFLMHSIKYMLNRYENTLYGSYYENPSLK